MKLGYLTFLLLGISVYSVLVGDKTNLRKKNGRNGKKHPMCLFGGLVLTGMRNMAPQKRHGRIFSGTDFQVQDF